MRYQDARQTRSKPGYRAIYVSGTKRYQIRDADDRPVGEPTTKEAAEARAERLQAEADKRNKRGLRPCLCCGVTFESEGIHNRMCNPCRARDDALAAYGYAGAGDGRKPRKSAGA